MEYTHTVFYTGENEELRLLGDFLSFSEARNCVAMWATELPKEVSDGFVIMGYDLAREEGIDGLMM